MSQNAHDSNPLSQPSESDQGPQSPLLEDEIHPNLEQGPVETDFFSIETRTTLLQQAKQEIFRRRTDAGMNFRKSLLVASNAVQAVNMLENLDRVAKEKYEQGVDMSELQTDVNDAKEDLDRAVREYSEKDIMDVEGLVEKMTLMHDPMYLEGEQKRKKRYMEEKRKEGMRKNTWMSSPSSRFVSITKGDFKGEEEITEEDQRRCISWCAWGFAIIGMIVAITFSHIEFWAAQSNPAVSTKLLTHENITLPVIYGCLGIPFLPSFQNLPNLRYSGSTLFGLRSFTNEESGRTLVYPETRRVVKEIFMGPQKQCLTAMKYLSKDDIVTNMDSNYERGGQCMSCLEIGGTERIVLNRERTRARSMGAITLEFAISSDIDYCFNPLKAGNKIYKNNIKEALKAHAVGLLDHGSLVLLRGPSVAFAIDYGFESLKGTTTEDLIFQQTTETSVLCNLYFFSGYFFPVKPETRIRYSFNMSAGKESWQKIGDPKNFHTIVPFFHIHQVPTYNRSRIIDEMMGTAVNDEFRTSKMNIYIYSKADGVDRKFSFNDLETGLRENHRDVLLFRKHIDDGVSYYSSHFLGGSRKFFPIMSRYFRFNISLDIESFKVEHVTRRPTTSVPEFLTDVFEYIGLFTGVCAYSVIVGPARMYLKRAKRRR